MNVKKTFIYFVSRTLLLTDAWLLVSCQSVPSVSLNILHPSSPTPSTIPFNSINEGLRTEKSIVVSSRLAYQDSLAEANRDIVAHESRQSAEEQVTAYIDELTEKNK